MGLNGSSLPGKTIGEQLGLGAAFVPGATAAWRVVTGMIGDQKAVFLILETVSGRTCVTLDTEGAIALSDELRKQSGGIVIPQIQLG